MQQPERRFLKVASASRFLKKADLEHAISRFFEHHPNLSRFVAHVPGVFRILHLPPISEPHIVVPPTPMPRPRPSRFVH